MHKTMLLALACDAAHAVTPEEAQAAIETCRASRLPRNTGDESER
jgi:hypothetical protein